MTLPPQPLRLFHPQFADHIDASTQVDRMPGTADAKCLCARPGRCGICGNETYDGECGAHPTPCAWPFCKPPEKESDVPSPQP